MCFYIKKIGLLFFLITSFCFNTKSQDRFKVGLLAGLVSSQVQGDTYAGFNKMGWGAGGFVNTFINEAWSIEMNIMYIQKGSRKNPRPTKGDLDTYLMRLHCIEVPFLLKYDYKKFIFEGGVAIANLVKYKESFNQLENPNGSFKSFELSGLIGMYYEVKKNLRSFVKFSNSITPIRAITFGTNIFNNGQYNTLIFLGLHYTINPNSD